MNRRKLLQILGLSTVAVVAAPNVLANNASEIYSLSHGGNITLQMIQDAFSKTKRPDKMIASLEGLTVYEEPKQGYDYSIGVNVGFGEIDPSCICVMRKGKDGYPDVQVAELVSNRLDQSSIVPVIAAIASKYGKSCIDTRGPMLVIEQIRYSGDSTQHQLKMLGFTRFFRMIQYRPSKPTTARDGWFSTAWSRPILTARFREAVDKGWYKSASAHSDEARDKAAALAYVGMSSTIRESSRRINEQA